MSRARAGPFGRSLRFLLGLFIAWSIAPFYVHGDSNFVLISSLLALLLFGLYVLLHRLADKHVSAGPVWLGPVLAFAPLALVYVFGVEGGLLIGRGEGQMAALTFLGISLLAAGLRGDAGCEVMTLPNILSKKRHHVACLFFAPVDRVERKFRKT